MSGDSEPVRLAVYREIPKPLPFRAREHAPYCVWCRWRSILYPYECYSPFINPEAANKWCSTTNRGGKCDGYSPSLWTRMLQLVRLRPCIERKRKSE